MPVSVVILAAGQGKRMRSSLPKVLHTIAGRPLLAHVVEAAKGLGDIYAVYGHGGGQVRKDLADLPVTWIEQAEQKGTGHALAQALPQIPDEHQILVLCGDVPLIRRRTLDDLIEIAGADGVALLTVELDDPTGYGRILRDPGGAVTAIVEQRDADADQLAIQEINTGILCAPAAKLRRWIEGISNNNTQGEYYLTDVIALAVADRCRVRGIAAVCEAEVAGVNDRAQLARLERAYQRERADELMAAGASLADPGRIDVRGLVTTGHDVFIDVGVILEGEVTLGDGVRIGAYCVLRDVALGANSEVMPFSHLESARCGVNCRIGPYARIRPGTDLADEVHVGNFVELKNAQVADGSKINHLSYVGDAQLGSDVNVGAGCITCNYDGAFKHHTIIGDGAFIGSDVQLVAPVTVGAGATIGAGTTVTKDAPPNELTLSRVPQQTIVGWKRPRKKG